MPAGEPYQSLLSSGTFVTVLADSISPAGQRLTSLEVQFNRYILPEVLTHRALSRNGSSTRAEPVRRQIARVAEHIAFPVEFGTNKPGMQAGPPLTGDELVAARAEWEAAAQDALRHASALADMGVHKQVTNRVIEPYAWQRMILTASDWENFFDQRCTPASGEAKAQPEFYVLADIIRDAITESEPVPLLRNEWHLPFVSEDEEDLPQEFRIALSVARCARVSFLAHGEVGRSFEKDLGLFLRLTSDDPPHWSPLEHVARPATWLCPGNFDGWLQLRHDERVTKVIEFAQDYMAAAA